jgi:hypothetical protein
VSEEEPDFYFFLVVMFSPRHAPEGCCLKSRSHWSLGYITALSASRQCNTASAVAGFGEKSRHIVTCIAESIY